MTYGASARRHANAADGQSSSARSWLIRLGQMTEQDSNVARTEQRHRGGHPAALAAETGAWKLPAFPERRRVRIGNIEKPAQR
jgi:hypothetical protein